MAAEFAPTLVSLSLGAVRRDRPEAAYILDDPWFSCGINQPASFCPFAYLCGYTTTTMNPDIS